MAAMVRVWSLLVATVMTITVSACGGCDPGRGPYLWPEPGDVVPWTATEFTIRVSDWWNTEDEIRSALARNCGPKFTSARVYETRDVGSAMHPNALRVQCGAPPPPKPTFRGQEVDPGMVIEFTAPTAPCPSCNRPPPLSNRAQ